MGKRATGEARCGGSSAPGDGRLDFDTDFTAVHVFTEEGIIQSTNRAFERLFGAGQEELLGKHQAALNNHSVAANLRLLRGICQEVESSGCWRGMLTNRHARGTEFTTRAHIYPMRHRGRRQFVCFQQPVRLVVPLGGPARVQTAVAVGAREA